jgi:hypothetical protein
VTWKRCPHTKEDGDQCGMTNGLNPDTGLCLWHDPEREDEARRIRSKGGKRKAEASAVLPPESPPAPTSVEDAAQLLSWLSHAVLRGEVDRHTARDVGYLLRAFVDASEVDVEDRLESVESLLESHREELEAIKQRGQMGAVR